jgi:hypothetical protein
MDLKNITLCIMTVSTEVQELATAFSTEYTMSDTPPRGWITGTRNGAYTAK